MSNLLQLLEQLATSTVSRDQHSAQLSLLTEQYQLSDEVSSALQQADLSRLVQLSGAPARGCFVIVTPDEPAPLPVPSQQCNAAQQFRH